MIVNRQEMTLLHLMEYIDVPLSEYTMPYAMTQDGIGAALGVTRSHVAVIVRRLEDKGQIGWILSHPKGAKAKRKIYYLNPEGIRIGHQLQDMLDEEGLTIDDIVRRPGTMENNSPNVIRAMGEMDKALRAVEAVRNGNDHEKAWEAIEHASIAIRLLTKEVA